MPTFHPFFDSLDYIDECRPPSSLTPEQAQDVTISQEFLKSYVGSQGTFNSYRREVERLLQWGILIRQKTLPQMRREDIEAFVHFCKKPPPSWIGLKKNAPFYRKWPPPCPQSRMASFCCHSL